MHVLLINDLQHLLSCTKKNFDIIAISETKITKQVSLLNNLNLNNYSFEFTPSETSAADTLLYVANYLSYKYCNDLNIYKKNELESTFIEIVNPKKSNILVGIIYRHPSMDLADFNCNYLNKLLENISKEQKSIFHLGDFNINLLNYNEHNQTNQFLDSLSSNSFIPLILQRTRITSHSNTLIDNIFSNVIDPDIISGNLTATISHHLPQFAKVVPVFKKDSKLDYSFYRPISLLSNIEKILEKLMYKRFYTFLNNNNIIYNLQFGFRQQYSTSHALINITEIIRKALDDGNTGYGVFVDL